MTGNKQLENYSPAYKAYMSRKRLSNTFPKFEVDADGNAILHPGEHFCRADNYNQVCGAKSKTIYWLKHHMHTVHSLKSRHIGKLKQKSLREDAFYKYLMQHEEYEGKVVEKVEEQKVEEGEKTATATSPRQKKLDKKKELEIRKKLNENRAENLRLEQRLSSCRRTRSRQVMKRGEQRSDRQRESLLSGGRQQGKRPQKSWHVSVARKQQE